MRDFSTIEKIETQEILVEIKDKEVVFADGSKYFDADDEIMKIAEWIKNNVDHNSDIVPERIKYLYSTTAKKDGGRFVLGALSLRTDVEKMVNNDYDYILSVHYKTWKELNVENKVIQLDKILCGIKVDEENKTKKVSVDSKEYVSNLRYYGPETVLNSSEIVEMTVERIVEQEKEEKKTKKNNSINCDIQIEDNE